VVIGSGRVFGARREGSSPSAPSPADPALSFRSSAAAVRLCPGARNPVLLSYGNLDNSQYCPAGQPLSRINTQSRMALHEVSRLAAERNLFWLDQAPARSSTAALTPSATAGSAIGGGGTKPMSYWLSGSGGSNSTSASGSTRPRLQHRPVGRACAAATQCGNAFGPERL